MKTLNINIDVTQRWLNKDQSVSFFTPLHLAVSLQNIEMAKLLLVCMAQPNKRGEWNENKGTPLHWALQDDQSPEIIKLLSNWPDVAPAGRTKLIHKADPQLRPVVISIFACSVRPYVFFQNLTKQNKFQVRIGSDR